MLILSKFGGNGLNRSTSVTVTKPELELGYRGQGQGGAALRQAGQVFIANALSKTLHGVSYPIQTCQAGVGLVRRPPITDVEATKVYQVSHCYWILCWCQISTHLGISGDIEVSVTLRPSYS